MKITLAALFFAFCRCLAGSAQTTLIIDTSERHQRIDNFGASDCWTAQVFGLFPDATRERMAEWLFSLDTATNGQPRGIGLSLWRFNVGAGSAEQGDKSGITDHYRRTECFQRPDGSYDWNKQAGQRWFLQAAKRRGVQRFLAFCNSAPVQMTANGLAGNRGRPKDGTCNLRDGQRDGFADFLATVIAELGRREGLSFDVVSPFNEPEWDWDEQKQEGSPALVSEIAQTVRALDRKLTARGLSTKILVTESGKIDYLFRSGTELKGRDNQIEALFDPASPHFIGKLPHVPPVVAGHSYWTTSPDEGLLAKRKALREKLDGRGLGYWETELCVMGNDREIGGGGGKDLTMKTALYVARVIHHDLCVAEASAWHWWLAMTNSDYKDGLIYVAPNAGLTDGEIADSKLLWALGNFSRFIRPGAVRVGVRASQAEPNDPAGLMVSAYVNESERTLACVMVNYADRVQPVRLAAAGVTVKAFTPYLTSDSPGDNLKPQPPVAPLTRYDMPARAVVTWVGRY